MKNINHYLRFDLEVVIRKIESHIGKLESISFLEFPDLPDLCNVAIGDESRPILILFQQRVIILHYHHYIPGADLLFPEEYTVTDSLVIAIGLLV